MPRKIKTLLLLSVLPAMVQWTACTKTYSTATDQSLTIQPPAQKLADYLKNNYAFSMFYAALQRVGLDKQLDGSAEYTLLLPDNDAFGRASITLDTLMTMDTAALRKWMGFHIIKGALSYDSVPQTVDNVYYSILGQKIYLSKPVSPPTNNPQPVMHANGTAINSFDISAADGYIQVLNTPLNNPLEGTLQDYINANLDQYSLFKACLQKFNLWDRLASDTSRPLTVFAPTNDAFQNIYVLNPYDNQYENYTITADTIAQWNTNVIPNDVFGAYLFPGRIFTSDYTDAPGNSYIMPDQEAILYFNNGVGIAAQLLTTSYHLRQFPYIFPPTSYILTPGDNYATVNGNNVLQPVGSLVMVP